MGGVAFILVGFEVGPMLSLKWAMVGEECILLAEIDRDNDGGKWLLVSDKGDSRAGKMMPW
jgi:hypothetical protein